MKINFFKAGHSFYPLRWYILVVIAVAGLMAYADLSGMRLMTRPESQQWNSEGPGYHK
jgi:hypothetical protein